MIALTATAAACGHAFYNVNTVAGWLFAPYLAWLSYATLLNYSIYKLNPDGGENNKETATITDITAAKASVSKKGQ